MANTRGSFNGHDMMTERKRSLLQAYADRIQEHFTHGEKNYKEIPAPSEVKTGKLDFSSLFSPQGKIVTQSLRQRAEIFGRLVRSHLLTLAQGQNVVNMGDESMEAFLDQQEATSAKEFTQIAKKVTRKKGSWVDKIKRALMATSAAAMFTMASASMFSDPAAAFMWSKEEGANEAKAQVSSTYNPLSKVASAVGSVGRSVKTLSTNYGLKPGIKNIFSGVSDSLAALNQTASVPYKAAGVLYGLGEIGMGVSKAAFGTYGLVSGALLTVPDWIVNSSKVTRVVAIGTLVAVSAALISDSMFGTELVPTELMGYTYSNLSYYGSAWFDFSNPFTSYTPWIGASLATGSAMIDGAKSLGSKAVSQTKSLAGEVWSKVTGR